MRIKSLGFSSAIAASLAAGVAATNAAPASAAQVAPAPTEAVTLSVGRGTLVRLASPMSDIFIADDKVADVQVRSPNQLYVFGKGPGETTVYATNKAGTVVWSSIVRVGPGLNSIGTMLKLAMPEAAITATPMNGMVLLTGTVGSPTDVAEAQNLVQAFVGKDTQVVSRIKAATPLQVNLQVKFAEVNRDVVKSLGVNLLTQDRTGGFVFGLSRADRAFATFNASDFGGTFNNVTDGRTTLNFAKRFLGLDVAAAIDLAESDGMAITLAQPNLTALSGETASFLAGGEIPIPVSQGNNQVTIEYKQYGISLAFTPTVLADGRISMRVRPEASQLSDAGAVTLNSFRVPALTTRRAETTVELGSGQSFVIGGLLSNTRNNSIDKAPILGDLPILGALFRSKNFNRSETELVIVVTPYLVKPVSANQVALPTDGYRTPTDFQQNILGQSFDGKTGEQRPMPRREPATPDQPTLGAVTPRPSEKQSAAAGSPNPGFSFN
jgi:pilus assembly protein CpaC